MACMDTQCGTQSVCCVFSQASTTLITFDLAAETSMYTLPPISWTTKNSAPSASLSVQATWNIHEKTHNTEMAMGGKPIHHLHCVIFNSLFMHHHPRPHTVNSLLSLKLISFAFHFMLFFFLNLYFIFLASIDFPSCTCWSLLSCSFQSQSNSLPQSISPKINSAEEICHLLAAAELTLMHMLC